MAKHNSTFAERCKARRIQLGLSKSEVGRRAGLSDVAILLIENGSTQRTRFILNLARALQCDPFWLESGDTDEKETPADK